MLTQRPCVICCRLQHRGDRRPRPDLSQAGGGRQGNLCPILRPRSWTSGGVGWGAEDGTAGGLFEIEAWAGHEADTAREGMNGETRSYSSGEPVGRARGMLICVCMRACVCVCVSRITERRARCADGGLRRCHFLLAGVCVSQSGRSAAETAPAYTETHTLELITSHM